MESELEISKALSKSPSKRRKNVIPKRVNRKSYRRRIERIQQNREEIISTIGNLKDVTREGRILVNTVMDGEAEAASLFPLYNQAINDYTDAMLKLRQIMLIERKLAAEIWGENDIASFDENTGIYDVRKHAIQDRLKYEFTFDYLLFLNVHYFRLKNADEPESEVTSTAEENPQSQEPTPKRSKLILNEMEVDTEDEENISMTPSTSTSSTQKKKSVRFSDVIQEHRYEC